MFSLDLGNYQSKACQIMPTGTVSLENSLGKRWTISSLREQGDHRVFSSFSKFASFNLPHALNSCTPKTLSQQLLDLYQLFTYLVKDFNIPRTSLTLTSTLQPPLSLIFNSLVKGQFQIFNSVPQTISSAARFYFTYYQQIQQEGQLLAEIFTVGEYQTIFSSVLMRVDKVQIVEQNSLELGAQEFDALICQLTQAEYKSNIEAVKKARQVLFTNAQAVVNLVDRDVVVTREQYIGAGQQVVQQIHALLQRQHKQGAIFEASGGAARDCLCIAAIENAGITQSKRLNWEECEASGALVYASRCQKMEFLGVSQQELALKVVQNGIEVDSYVLLNYGGQVPSKIQKIIHIKPHTHLQVKSGQFLLRVYEYYGNFQKNITLKIEFLLNGDCFIESKELKEVFSYEEKSLIDEIQAREQQLEKQDEEWHKAQLM